MNLGNHVNWFYEDKCNLDCPYCFGPKDVWGPSFEQRKFLAEQLIEGGVQKVTMGGGEPTLGKGLVSVLKMLSSAGVETSVHTNGLLFNEKLFDQMAGVTDIIGLPIDSLNSSVQARLRGPGLIMCLKNCLIWCNRFMTKKSTLKFTRFLTT